MYALNQASNINLLWGQLIIEELVRLGVTDVCIAPGSRSTPLTLAAAQYENTHEKKHEKTIETAANNKQAKLNVYCHFDERGLGFFALGIAKATQRPVAIITTSGSAVANLLPAAVEAFQSNVPLIFLTADRPNELLACNANQAIAQHGIFADFSVQQCLLPPASTEVPANFVLTSIDNAVTNGISKQAPVHINCMFREPLYPTDKMTDYTAYLANLKAWQQSKNPYTNYQVGCFSAQTDTSLTQLTDKKALVVIGKIAQKSDALAILDWATKQGWPVITDCQSNLRGEQGALQFADLLLLNPQFKQALEQAQVIIQFGGTLISKRLLAFINDKVSKQQTPYWLVAPHHNRIDPNHIVSVRFTCAFKQWLASASDIRNQNLGPSWGEKLYQLDSAVQAELEHFDCELLSQKRGLLTEYSICRTLPKLLPQNAQLFVGNSMPIRLVDMLNNESVNALYASRGASGIDGLLATAIGIKAAQPEQPVALLIGDTSLLHDLNSLALAKAHKLIIVVLNNDGGAIFNMLPVPNTQQEKARFYQMPHGLNFEHAATMFALDYFAPDCQEHFDFSIDQALKNDNAALIEVTVPPTQATEQIQELKVRVEQLAL